LCCRPRNYHHRLSTQHPISCFVVLSCHRQRKSPQPRPTSQFVRGLDERKKSARVPSRLPSVLRNCLNHPPTKHPIPASLVACQAGRRRRHRLRHHVVVSSFLRRSSQKQATRRRLRIAPATNTRPRCQARAVQ